MAKLISMDSAHVSYDIMLKEGGTHWEAMTLEVLYTVCNAEDCTLKAKRVIRKTFADPSGVTLTQAMDAIRDDILDTEG